jgi:hypothetical protein
MNDNKRARSENFKERKREHMERNSRVQGEIKDRGGARSREQIYIKT